MTCKKLPAFYLKTWDPRTLPASSFTYKDVKRKVAAHSRHIIWFATLVLCFADYNVMAAITNIC